MSICCPIVFSRNTWRGTANADVYGHGCTVVSGDVSSLNYSQISYFVNIFIDSCCDSIIVKGECDWSSTYL